ncbi:homeobox-leucine zipper protein ROC8-like [Solanum stenotomum]|uniref:homeobox-leucine zipper protein ROC8-like n=1 Tax=Solanum stenotomum TaxID=172797 RepID=UPI0020D0AAF9|nr:homeobox-leucine zipper protein ROC8-like [Solanum stenotomum]
MTDSGEEPVGESSNSQKRSKRHRQYHRHSMEQIQRLEAFFKKCPHPDEDQQKQLGREAGLDHKQVKFWFQNKRTQTKIQNDKSVNNALRKENERFLIENKAMKEAMKNIMCPKCDGPPIGKEERERNLENMKMENQWLTEQYEKVSNLISSVVGRPFVMDSNLVPPKPTLGSSSNSSDGSLLNQNICGSPIRYPPLRQENNHNNNNNVQAHSININNIPVMSPSPQEHDEFHHDNRQKTITFETVVASMNEMLELLKMNDPIWVDSSSDVRSLIHREGYERPFPNQVQPYQTSNARIESSKDCGIVSMTAIELIDNFLDPVKWMNLFPTIVTKARTIKVLDSGTWRGSIQLMYEKLHILSPLVEARDFFFIRCCRQLDPTTWIMMDVSYDIFNEIQSGVPSYSWKFPSGCAIQDMGNGQSKVTWVEHVQVYEKYQVNRIFRNLLCGRETYGAKRWIVTLQRMSERYSFAMGATCPTRHDFKGVFHDPEGLKNTIQVSQRMVKSFFEILSMTDKLDFPTSSQLNRGDSISIRKNEEITQPKGFIAIAATSLWLPFSFQDVFNFFKDDKTRSQWDILTGGNNMIELDRVLTGTFPGNNITIIQPCNMHKEMLMLEETSIDEMGAFLVYAPIELRAITSIVNGGDATKVPILPSGIIISPDGRLSSNRDYAANAQNGSILTVAFQILICGNNNPTSKQQQMEVVASVHGVLSATILKIKAALGCSDL